MLSIALHGQLCLHTNERLFQCGQTVNMWLQAMPNTSAQSDLVGAHEHLGHALLRSAERPFGIDQRRAQIIAVGGCRPHAGWAA